MKKLALIMSLMVCLLCFIGCNNNEVVENQPVENNPIEDFPIMDEPVFDEPIFDEPVFDDEPVVEQPSTDKPVVDEPATEKVVDLYATMTNIITKAEAEVRMPMQEAIPVEVSFSFMGITEEDFNTYVAESIVYESMVSPANQSVCLVRVNDSSKVADLKKSVIDNCNPRKWICMSAEKAVVVDSGDYILLAMADADKCDSIVKAFTEEFGSAGEVLTKGGDL